MDISLTARKIKSASVTDRRQIGPMTLDELVDVFTRVLLDPDREGSVIDGELKRLVFLQESARRRYVKESFGGLASGEALSQNDRVLALLDPRDVGPPKGPDGSIDYLAFYHPWLGTDIRSGIYFIRSRIFRTLWPIPA